MSSAPGERETAREGTGVPGGFGAVPHDETATSPLLRLRRSLLFFLLAALVGGSVGFVGGAARGPRYRAAATLIVVEPRGAPPGSVDYQLTPVRSYTALLSSPALAASCGADPSLRVRVRMPETTRLLEVSVEGKDAAAASALAGCIATRAVEENRRLNAEVARRGEVQVGAALSAARGELEKREAELARLRVASSVELRRAALKAALRDLEFATNEERPAAEARAAALEREFASREEELIRLRRRVEEAAAALTELERRSALAPLESASKAFDLQVVAPPPALAPRVGPAPLLVAALGALAAVFLAALLVLSRPQ